MHHACPASSPSDCCECNIVCLYCVSTCQVVYSPTQEQLKGGTLPTGVGLNSGGPLYKEQKSENTEERGKQNLTAVLNTSNSNMRCIYGMQGNFEEHHSFNLVVKFQFVTQYSQNQTLGKPVTGSGRQAGVECMAFVSISLYPLYTSGTSSCL